MTRAANSPFPLRTSVTKTGSSRYKDLRLDDRTICSLKNGQKYSLTQRQNNVTVTTVALYVCVCVCVCVTWECERRSDERSVHKVYWCLHEYVVSETRTSIHTGTASILYVSSSVCYFLWHSIKIFYLRMKNIHCIHDTKGIQTLAFDFAFQCRLLSSHACPE